MSCKHNTETSATVNLNYLEDSGRYMADVTLSCVTCGKRFKFLGLPLGLDLNGAAVSFDGHTASLAVAPDGETIPPLKGVEGYSIRKCGGS